MAHQGETHHGKLGEDQAALVERAYHQALHILDTTGSK